MKDIAIVSLWIVMMTLLFVVSCADSDRIVQDGEYHLLTTPAPKVPSRAVPPYKQPLRTCTYRPLRDSADLVYAWTVDCEVAE